MAAAIIFKPENRLASIVSGPGGVTVDALQRAASENLAKIEAGVRAYVDDQLETIRALNGKPEEIIFAECAEINEAALAICEVAGAAGLPGLGNAARALHVMVDSLFTQGVWHTEALKLHMEAVIMFAANPNLGPTEALQVLARLKGMRDLIGVTA